MSEINKNAAGEPAQENTAPATDSISDTATQEAQPKPDRPVRREPREPIITSVDFDALDDPDIDYSETTSAKRRAGFGGEMGDGQSSNKQSFFSKLRSSLRYRYALEIGVVALVVAIGVLAWLGNREETFDYYIGVYTYSYQPTEQQLDRIGEIFGQYAEDLDGDGEIKISVESIMPYTGSYSSRYKGNDRFQDDVYGEAYTMFYLVDEPSLEYWEDRYNAFFLRRINRQKVELVTDTEFFDMGDAGEFPMDMYFAQAKNSTFAQDREASSARFENGCVMMEKIMADYPEFFAPITDEETADTKGNN